MLTCRCACLVFEVPALNLQRKVTQSSHTAHGPRPPSPRLLSLRGTACPSLVSPLSSLQVKSLQMFRKPVAAAKQGDRVGVTQHTTHDTHDTHDTRAYVIRHTFAQPAASSGEHNPNTAASITLIQRRA